MTEENTLDVNEQDNTPEVVETKAEKSLTQADIDRIVKREKERAKASERTSILAELEVDSIDSLKSLMNTYQDRIAALEAEQQTVSAKLTEYKAQEADRLRKASLKEHVDSLNLVNTDAFYKLADDKLNTVFSDDGHVNAESFNAVITDLRNTYPFLFKTRGNDVALSKKPNFTAAGDDDVIKKAREAVIRRTMNNL